MNLKLALVYNLENIKSNFRKFNSIDFKIIKWKINLLNQK